jgi:hypothetical protein
MPLEYEFHRLVQEGNPFIGYMGPSDDLFPKVLGFPPAPTEPCFDKGPGFNQSGLDPLQTKDQITLHRILPLFLGIQAEPIPSPKETSPLYPSFSLGRRFMILPMVMGIGSSPKARAFGIGTTSEFAKGKNSLRNLFRGIFRHRPLVMPQEV